ncbi:MULTISPECIES: DUF4097 family beta strand repeat-containing protein [unclassified Streptomyces]|uniref:DUF4097 family beta strand repeat-containing protein n=1 Tax=unclassified Streptomyces TaxID=2593676 RepID=UPI001905200D|nr:DUF4097 family beta strand repeat-containing protein [Streptomyces sp. HSG2]
MQKFDTPAPVAAVLDIPAGRVRFIAAEQTDTTVEVLPADASRSRDVTAAEQTTVTCTDGTLRIDAPTAKNQVLGSSGTVEVTVHLPAGSRVEAKAADIQLHGTGRLGHVALDSARASVDLAEAEGARLILAAGDVTVHRLNGPAEISTQKGDLRVTEALRGSVTLRTEHGDITVGAARGTSATLDAGTTHGRIDNSLNNTDGPDAALTIHATTAYGDITARSL